MPNKKSCDKFDFIRVVIAPGAVIVLTSLLLVYLKLSDKTSPLALETKNSVNSVYLSKTPAAPRLALLPAARAESATLPNLHLEEVALIEKLSDRLKAPPIQFEYDIDDYESLKSNISKLARYHSELREYLHDVHKYCILQASKLENNSVMFDKLEERLAAEAKITYTMHENSISDLKERLDAMSNDFKWFFGLCLTSLLSCIAVAVTVFLSSRDKKEQKGTGKFPVKKQF